MTPLGPLGRRIKRSRKGGVDLRIPPAEREFLRSLAPEMREVIEDPDDPVILPWQNGETQRDQARRGTSGVYLKYLDDRADSVIAALRAGLPDADPWLLPLAALLTAMGLTEIYRLNPLLARDQSVWIVIGVAGFLGLILLLGDHRRLEPYKYTLGVAAVVLLLITMVIGTTINWLISIAGLILFVVTTAMWIRDTRRDISELPEEHLVQHQFGTAREGPGGSSTPVGP